MGKSETGDVVAAFKFFGCDTSVTDDVVRAKYLELIKQYHPDRVAQLGEELRTLAGEKTRQINHQ
jgi:DnaJ-domain-containing protein 1